MAKKKETIDDGRRMGQFCGYTLMHDGRIRVAPIYEEQFEKTSTERRGINDLMKLFSSHCADLLAEIARRESVIWDRICEDYGLDRRGSEIKFDGTYLTITPKTPDEPTQGKSEGGGK